ncbi:MAG TPA: hypothetical protein DCR97_09410 [Deltaproteobacteria bacterium]|nr:hypothetical protein [Deltaproteobacteria bacterium]
MGRWIVIIVSGICFSLSAHVSILAFRFGDGRALLFAGFGLLSGAFFVVSTMRTLAEKVIERNNTDDRISENPEPVSFDPHRFAMLGLIVTVIGVLAAP